MERAYIAAIVAEYLDEQKPVDTYPSEGGFDSCSSQDLAEEAIKGGYVEPYYDDLPVKVEKIDDPGGWPNYGNVKLRPTVKGFYYVMGPR